MLSGSSWKKNPRFRQAKSHFQGHSFDYEASLNELNNRRLIKKPYIVYLDEKYILSHSEFIAGFQFYQFTTDFSTGTRTYTIPYWYDPYVFNFSGSYSPDTLKGFTFARGEFYTLANDSLTLS